MMYDLPAVLSVLKNRVGFRSTTEIPLNADLSQSDSGLIFNSFHVQLTPQMLKSCTPDDFNNNADEEVRRNTYLTELRDEQIATILNRFFTEKLLKKTTNGLDRSRIVFSGGGSRNNLTPKIDSTVGWRFNINQDPNFLTKIRRVSFHGTESDTIELKLYNSSLGEVDSVVLEYDTPNQIKWFDVDFSFKNFNPSQNYSSPDWFIGYDSNAYAGKAIKTGQSWGTSCRSCGLNYHYSSYQQLKGNGIFMMSSSFQNSLGYDVENLVDDCDNSHGLNLDIWAGCDYTQFIIDNAAIGVFDNAIYMNVGVQLLSLIINNPSTNIYRDVSNVEGKLEFIRGELYGNKEAGVVGLINKASNAIKALHVNTEGLSSRCFKRDTRGQFTVTHR